MKIKKDQIFAFLTLLPSVILIAVFVYGFIGNTVYVSMSDWGKEAALARDPQINFIGFENYVKLFTSFLEARFRQDLVNAFFYSFFLLVGALSMGLFIAILLDRKPKGENAFRTIFLYPMSLSFIVTGTIWRWLLSPQGGVNVLPNLFGMPRLEFQWLSSRKSIPLFNWQNIPQIVVFLIAILLIILGLRAFKQKRQTATILYFVVGGVLVLIGILGRRILPVAISSEEIHGFNLATVGIIIAAIWQYSGYTMALYLAGLQGIPQNLTESARLDGATEFQYYLRVAIPMLKPITVSAVIILSHISLKLFGLIFAMTGPDNAETGHPSVLMYLKTFRANNFAAGAAVAVVLFLLAATFIIPYLIYSYKERIEA